MPIPAASPVLRGLDLELPAGTSLGLVGVNGAGKSTLVSPGWDTILAPQYTGGVDLSGGQWQRIALARALYAIEAGAGDAGGRLLGHLHDRPAGND